MKYKIVITTEDSELLDIYEIDTDDSNWNSDTEINLLGKDIFDEIERDFKKK